jgi:hypothetical protein
MLQLQQALRLLANLLDEPSPPMRLGFVAEHLLNMLDVTRASLIDALVDRGDRFGIPRPRLPHEKAAKRYPGAHEDLDEAVLDHELHRAWEEFVAADSDDPRVKTLARLRLEQAIYRRFPTWPVEEVRET